jgi:hypothetical protein
MQVNEVNIGLFQIFKGDTGIVPGFKEPEHSLQKLNATLHTVIRVF